MERNQIITFNKGINNKIEGGSKWKIQFVGDEKGNFVLIRIGKRGKQLSYLNNDNNIAGISTESMDKLMENGICEVTGVIA